MWVDQIKKVQYCDVPTPLFFRNASGEISNYQKTKKDYLGKETKTRDQ